MVHYRSAPSSTKLSVLSCWHKLSRHLQAVLQDPGLACRPDAKDTASVTPEGDIGWLHNCFHWFDIENGLCYVTLAVLNSKCMQVSGMSDSRFRRRLRQVVKAQEAHMIAVS